MTEMIPIASVLWFAAGLLAGFAHAATLWRTVRRLSAWTPLLGFLRLTLVALLLVAAALAGEILSTAAGWATSFAAGSISLSVRRAARGFAPQRCTPGE